MIGRSISNHVGCAR